MKNNEGTLEGSKTWRDIKAQQSYGLPYISKRYCNCLYMAITIIYYSLISTLLFVKNHSIAHSILSMPPTCNFLFLQYLFIANTFYFKHNEIFVSNFVVWKIVSDLNFDQSERQNEFLIREKIVLPMIGRSKIRNSFSHSKIWCENLSMYKINIFT